MCGKTKKGRWCCPRNSHDRGGRGPDHRPPCRRRTRPAACRKYVVNSHFKSFLACMHSSKSLSSLVLPHDFSVAPLSASLASFRWLGRGANGEKVGGCGMCDFVVGPTVSVERWLETVTPVRYETVQSSHGIIKDMHIECLFSLRCRTKRYHDRGRTTAPQPPFVVSLNQLSSFLLFTPPTNNAVGWWPGKLTIFHTPPCFRTGHSSRRDGHPRCRRIDYRTKIKM